MNRNPYRPAGRPIAVLMASTVLASWAALPTPALAQDATAEAQPTATPRVVQPDGSIVLQPIVLRATDGATEGTGSYTAPQATTSTGLTLSPRETPQSVSVTTSQQIEDQNLTSTLDVLNRVTGVNAYQDETDRSAITARGYYVDSNYVIDGIEQPGSLYWFGGVSELASTATYDRVEVLRGAAGLLTGSGEPGAAVSITRKRATARQPEGTVTLRYGSWNRLGGTLDYGTPLTRDGRVRGRFIVDAANGDSYVDRYHVNKRSYYAAIDADLTPSTQLRFTVDHKDHKPRSTMWGGLPSIYSNGEPTDYPSHYSTAPDWAFWAAHETSLVAEIEHNFDSGWTAKASVGAQLFGYKAEVLYLSGDVDPVTGVIPDPSIWTGLEKRRGLTLQAEVNGPVQLFGREHELNFGIRSNRDWIRRSWPGYSGTVAGGFSPDGYDGDYPRPDFNDFDLPDWDSNVTKNSAYASGRFSISDPLKVIVGGRYTKWTSNYDTDDRAFGEFTPFLGAVYDVSNSWSLYASYTDVFNPQDYQDRNGSYLDPATGRSYEIGAKAEVLNGGANVTIAVFDTLQDNVAVADGDYQVPGTVNQAYRAAQGIRTKGVEVEFSGEVRPGWNLLVGATALRARDADDNRANPDLPTQTLKLFTTYELPGDLDEWTLGGGVRWQNGAYTDITTDGGNTYRFRQKAYAVVGLMARYDLNDRWSAQLNVDNVFDKKFFSYPSYQTTYGAPRNATIALVAKF